MVRNEDGEEGVRRTEASSGYVLRGFRVRSSRGVGLGLSGGAAFTLLLVYVSNR